MDMGVVSTSHVGECWYTGHTLVDTGDWHFIPWKAPDWCVQCFGIELVAVRLIVLLNFIRGLRIKSKLWEAAKPPTH